MDSREHISAANALIGWFNSQEIASADSRAIMSKVLAKLLVEEMTKTHKVDVIDEIMHRLIADVNDRFFHVRRR